MFFMSADQRLPGKPLCDLCGEEMVERNCEWLCPNCGFRRDCTDP
jgi:predicted RNA-binding Zn-ribbon protein involved in translation (DUF1610 family)